MTARASCIVAEPGDKRTLCGHNRYAGGNGTCWAKYVQAHIDGRDPLWCERCLYLWSTGS